MLGDFVAKFTPSTSGTDRVCQISVQPWQLYIDGASNARGVGIGIILVSLKGIRLEH